MKPVDAQQLLDMDAVFARIGGSGRYNIFTLLVIFLGFSFSVSITLSPVFTTMQLPANCTDERSDQVDNSTDSTAETVFEETAASRFGLVCDRAFLAGLPTSFYFLGFTIGCVVYGGLADRIGRLRVVQISQFNLAICTIGASQAPWLWLYCVLQVIAGHGDGGITACGMAYTVEFTDAKHRGVWALNLYNGSTIGAALFVLIAFLFRNYQQQLLCAGLCSLVFSLSLFLLSESPRWLASVGRFAEADRVLRRIDRLNNGRSGLKLPKDFSTESLFARQRNNADVKPASTDSFRRLMKEPRLRRRTLFCWFLFFAVSIAYFGVALGVGRLGGNVFVNQLASAAVEPPSRFFCALVSLRLGRRPSVCGSFGLAGLCLLGVAVLSDFPALTAWRVGMAMAGKFWINMAFDLTFLYGTEVFPTDLRSVGVGSGSSMSRVGALISTLVPALGTLWRPLPFLLFASFALAAAATAPFLMTETRGRRLPEALQLELEMDKATPLIPTSSTNGNVEQVFEDAEGLVSNVKAVDVEESGLKTDSATED